MSLGPTSHRFTSQRLQLHYVDWGNQDATPLLLIHGGRDHCRNWDWTAAALSNEWHIIAPDLRGHGDSAWSNDGDYTLSDFTCDLAQLIHQLDVEQVNIVAHSLGGSVALRYAGIYPEKVRRLAVIEGLRPLAPISPDRAAMSTQAKQREWIESRRASASRVTKRYGSLEEAYQRMKTENPHLNDNQARHLTQHGTVQNEDGSYSWKFDNYLRTLNPTDLSDNQLHSLWQNITCPTLLMYGADSWAENPENDGRLEHFQNTRVIEYENAGHWLHHDQFDDYIRDLKAFLK